MLLVAPLAFVTCYCSFPCISLHLWLVAASSPCCGVAAPAPRAAPSGCRAAGFESSFLFKSLKCLIEQLSLISKNAKLKKEVAG